MNFLRLVIQKPMLILCLIKDRLEIDKRKDEFDFYKGQASFNGNLLMQPTGVTGMVL